MGRRNRGPKAWEPAPFYGLPMSDLVPKEKPAVRDVSINGVGYQVVGSTALGAGYVGLLASSAELYRAAREQMAEQAVRGVERMLEQQAAAFLYGVTVVEPPSPEPGRLVALTEMEERWRMEGGIWRAPKSLSAAIAARPRVIMDPPGTTPAPWPTDPYTTSRDFWMLDPFAAYTPAPPPPRGSSLADIWRRVQGSLSQGYTFLQWDGEDAEPQELVSVRRQVGAILAKRCWRVRRCDDGEIKLMSVYKRDLWEGPTLSADILPTQDREDRHGINTYARRERMEYDSTATVAGIVRLWGRVVVHERGFRAEHASIVRLGVLPGSWIGPPAGISASDWVVPGCTCCLCEAGIRPGTVFMPPDEFGNHAPVEAARAEVMAALERRYQCEVDLINSSSEVDRWPTWDE